jgi:hypothetical protein
MFIPNLLLLAGTGTKSGKTTIACRIIEQFPWLDISAIKITPHFHDTTTGLIPVIKNKGYSVFQETDSETSKDTSRMLHSGAHSVYLAQVWDDELPKVFREIMELIPENTPVICESPALRNYIEPGVFIIMTAETINKPMNINHLQTLPHLMFKLEDLENIESIPIGFEDGKWVYEV